MDFVKDTNSYGKTIIATRDYFDLIRAARDLEILRRSYMTSTFGIPSDVTAAVFGPKPSAPKPDPADVAATAALAAANRAQSVAEQVDALVKLAKGEPKC